MEEPDEQVRQTTTQLGNTRETTQEVRRPKERSARKQNVASRVIWFIAGVLLVILGIRFVLVLLGATKRMALPILYLALAIHLFRHSLAYSVISLNMEFLNF